LQPFARALLIIDYSNRLRNPRTHRTLAVAAVDDHLEATVERQLHQVSADHLNLSLLTRPDYPLFAPSWRGVMTKLFLPFARAQSCHHRIQAFHVSLGPFPSRHPQKRAKSFILHTLLSAPASPRIFQPEAGGNPDPDFSA